MNGMKILLLEDDEALAMGIEYSLKNEGYTVERISTYQEGLLWLRQYIKNPVRVAALFDVMLPDGNGFDLLQEFRRAGINIPVLFLTAISDEINVVQGLEIGADDYITKPFRVKELLSRLKAVIRRYDSTSGSKQPEVRRQESDAGVYRYRDLIIETNRASVIKCSAETEDACIELTSGEYRLLLYLVQNQGIVLERTRILERVFDKNGTYIDDNTLSVYMKRLRDKIGDTDKNVPYIKTIRGIGYMMERENACQ